MKEKLALVIAVLMITSVAYALSTTSVGASPGSATISPDKVGGNKWMVLTISVTNETSHEIYRILIRDEPENDWDVPIGGHASTFSVAENWDNVAENLSAAATALSQVSDNLEEALANLKAAGVALECAADNLDSAGSWLTMGADNVANQGENLKLAADNLKAAGTALKTEPENLLLIGAQLRAAEAYIALAGAAKNDNISASGTNGQENLAADNLVLIASQDYLDNAAQMIENGNFHLAGDNLYGAGAFFINAGTCYINYTGAGSGFVDDAGVRLHDSVGPLLRQAGDNLKLAGENLQETGTALSNLNAANFENAENIAMDNDKNTLAYLGSTDGLDNMYFSDNIKQAADNLIGTDNNENILTAGTNIKEAALALHAVQDSTMVEFGSRYLGTRSDSVDNMLWSAGDNLSNDNRVINITTAVNAIDNAAKMLENAKTKLKATADLLAPTYWALTEPVNGDVALEAENGEYQIAVGGSKTFKFLWKAPSPATSKTYTFKLYYYDNTWPTAGEGAYRGYDTVTIEVDITAPKVVTFKVTQTGGVENVVGSVRDNGKAKITLVASEALSELNTMYIENTSGDNKFPPISMSEWTTDDNITFTYEFAVSAWDNENMWVRIAGPWATDEYLNENTATANDNFIVDTTKPIFVDNGLWGKAGFPEALENIPWKHQAGTGTRYRTDNDAEQTINGIVQDNDWWCNYAGTKRYGYDNLNTVVIPSITVTWDNSTDNTDMLPGENFYWKENLSEGLNSVVRITATDWAGNSDNVYIENILIDTTPPTIAFNTLSGTTWDENGEIIGDNTPEIKVTITDPGYPDSGLGVAHLARTATDNLRVYLDNDDNIDNPLPAAPYGLLDNKAAWDPSTGVFENLIDNAGKGLVDGTYWIIVAANDNLRHAAAENENWAIAKQSFTIDTSVPTWTTTTAQTAIICYEPTTMQNLTASLLVLPKTKITTWYIEGGAQKAGSTMYIYAPDNTTQAGTATASTTINATTGLYDFSLSVTLDEGVNKVYIEEVDQANNSSGRVLYGTFTVDKTPPVITLSEPTTGISTGEAQITVSGTVVDALVAYDELTVEIDCTGAAVIKTVYLNADGSFSTTIPLVEGTNVINVVAKDSVAITSIVGNQTISSVTVTRAVTPWATYAIIIVIVALIIAAIAIFRKR